MFKVVFKMEIRKLMLLSSSNVHGHEYLQYAAKDITEFLKRNGVTKILFIPYALLDRDAYYKKINDVFTKWGFQVDSAHNFDEPADAVADAQAFFVGGGNTFLLLRTLYEYNLIEAIRRRVLEDGAPYIGTSAGTNVATVSICTTNDMPIVCPPSFDALKLVPFNINPHYMDADERSTHKGETREERILQFCDVNANKKVLGMREGVHLHVENGTATLKGFKSSRLFVKGQEPKEIPSGTDVTFLLEEN
ncbi:uncharacterized protein CBL_03258 [Carabus blaptoides fortunei]